MAKTQQVWIAGLHEPAVVGSTVPARARMHTTPATMNRNFGIIAFSSQVNTNSIHQSSILLLFLVDFKSWEILKIVLLLK
jgi:hypothetical protein